MDEKWSWGSAEFAGPTEAEPAEAEGTARSERSEIMPCGIFVDEEGDWYHEGNRIVRDEIIELFFEHLVLISGERFLLEWENSRCLLDVADTPFVISRVDLEKTGQGEQVLLSFRHRASRHPLAPGTLWVGRANVLYCRVHDGRFRARFSRPAYYQFAALLREDDGRFFISLDGTRHFIREADPAGMPIIPAAC